MNLMQSSKPVAVVECGCCNHFHHASFSGDCRDDGARLTDEQLDAQFGAGSWSITDAE